MTTRTESTRPGALALAYLESQGIMGNAIPPSAVPALNAHRDLLALIAERDALKAALAHMKLGADHSSAQAAALAEELEDCRGLVDRIADRGARDANPDWFEVCKDSDRALAAYRGTK